MRAHSHGVAAGHPRSGLAPSSKPERAGSGRGDERSPNTSAERGPVRVLLACDHIDHDGALHGGGRQLVELTRALQGARVKPTVVVLRGASRLGHELRAEGLPFRFLGHARFDPRSAWSLYHLIRREDVDLVHLTDFGACTLGRLAAAAAGVPSVVHVRSHHSEHQPRGFPVYVNWAYRALAPLTDRVIANSRSVKSFAVERMGFEPERVVVMNNPLARFSFSAASKEHPRDVQDIRARHGIAPEDPVVGAVTRFHAAKGIRYLVEAFPGVLGERPDAHLVLVGEGPERPELEARAEALGIADRVVFAGFRRDVESYYAMFDISTVPSIEEGFGNVAVEAMALGTPVVASDLGGLREIITHGRDGLLVPAADPRSLAEAILHLLRDPELRRRMGSAASERSRDFSLEGYVETLERLYRDVLSEGRRSRTRSWPRAPGE